MGEGNKSELYNALVFPQNEKEIADLYSVISDSLGIERSHVFGASNGGYVAMCYTYHYPERVRTLSLFGPMGLTKLTNSSFFMLSVATMYPFRFIRNYVAKWALGESEYCNEKYGDWFNSIMKGTIPSLARPAPMTTVQKGKMKMPVLLFLGTKDRIVGDAEVAKKTAEEYPDIRIEIMESGHLISAEHYEIVNAVIKEFLEENEDRIKK
jgi:pimeloyl-ACP methyl ester carboxylesterase